MQLNEEHGSRDGGTSASPSLDILHPCISTDCCMKGFVGVKQSSRPYQDSTADSGGEKAFMLTLKDGTDPLVKAKINRGKGKRHRLLVFLLRVSVPVWRAAQICRRFSLLSYFPGAERASLHRQSLLSVLPPLYSLSLIASTFFCLLPTNY